MYIIVKKWIFSSGVSGGAVVVYLGSGANGTGFEIQLVPFTFVFFLAEKFLSNFCRIYSVGRPEIKKWLLDPSRICFLVEIPHRIN